MDVVVLLTFGYAFLLGVLNVGIKISDREMAITPVVRASLFYLFSAIFIFSFVCVFGELSFPSLRELMPYSVNLILMVVLNAVGIIFVFSSLQKMEVGVFTILFSLNVLFTLFFSSLFLGEKLEWIQYLGILFVLLGVLVVYYKKGRGGCSVNNFLLVFIASFCIGGAITNTKFLLTSPSPFNHYSYSIMSFIFSALFIFLTSFKKVIKGFSGFKGGSFVLWMVGLSFIHALMLFFLYLALSFPDSNSMQISGIMSSSVLFGVVLSIIFLGEREDLMRKFLAMAVTFIGLYLIK